MDELPLEVLMRKKFLILVGKWFGSLLECLFLDKPGKFPRFSFDTVEAPEAKSWVMVDIGRRKKKTSITARAHEDDGIDVV